MNNDGAFITFVGAMCLILGLVIGGALGCGLYGAAWKDDAVARGFAEYTVNLNGGTNWKWRESK